MDEPRTVDAATVDLTETQQQQQPRKLSRREKLELWKRGDPAAAKKPTLNRPAAAQDKDKENHVPSSVASSVASDCGSVGKPKVSGAAARPPLHSVSQNQTATTNTTGKPMKGDHQSQQLDMLHNKYKQLQKTVKFLQDTVAKKECAAVALQQQLSQAETKISALSDVQSGSQAALKVQRDLAESLRQERDHLASELADIKAATDDTTSVEQLRPVVSVDRIDALKAERDTIAAELLECEQLVESLDEELQTARAELDTMTQQQHDSFSKCLAAEAKQSQMAATIEQLNEQVVLLGTALTDALAENERLHLSANPPCARQDQSCQTSQDVVAVRSDDIVALRASNDIMFQQMVQNQQTYDASLGKLRRTSTHWKAEAEKAIKENVVLQSQLDEVTLKYEAANKSFLAEQARNDENQRHVTELERLIAEVMPV